MVAVIAMTIDNVYTALLARIPSNGLTRALLLQSCQRGRRRRFELEPLLNGSLQNLTSIKAWINPAWKRLNGHRDGGFLHGYREMIDHGVDHSNLPF